MNTFGFSHNARVMMMLVYRDIIMIKQRLRGSLIDSSIQLIVNVVVFGGMMPMLGLPVEYVGPLYIGAMTAQMFYFGTDFGYTTIYDIRYTRFIDYRLTLPLSKRWLFASYIINFMMETFIITAPMLFFGIFLLGSKFTVIHASIPLFFLVYSMALCLFGLMFLGCSLYYEYDWFMQNLWPRRLTFLFLFSPIFLLWHRVYDFSPVFARLMLLSPLTYTTEGLRATLIGGDLFIPVPVCLTGTAIFIFLSIIFVACGVKKRLDPV